MEKMEAKYEAGAVMTEKEEYSTFLFFIGERGRELFNTWTWLKKVDADGNPTDENDNYRNYLRDLKRLPSI